MKNLFIIFFIFQSISCCAQKFYDYQDTRRKNESFIRLPKTLIRNDLATFTLSGTDESVGKDELQRIPFTTFSADSMNFEGDNIKASIKLTPFDKAKHKLDYDEKYLIRIDRKTYYGDYGEIPKTSIGNILLIIDNDTVVIPPIAYFDIHNVNLTYTDNGTIKTRNGIYKSKDGHRVYIYIFCKNKTGSYEVTWVIQDKQYLRRVLDYGFM